MSGSGACARCHSRVEAGDLRCPVCAFVLPGDANAARGPVAQIMRCASCGAAVSYDAAAQAPRCAFCDSTMHVESVQDPQEQTELFLPFAFGPEQAQQSVRSWLATLGWLRPSSLASEARVASLKPLYWVGWLSRAEAEISWTADSDAGAGRSAWAPHAGIEAMIFDRLIVSASRGLSAAEAGVLAPSYDSTRGGAQPQAPPGFLVEQFDVQRSEARGEIMTAITALATARVQGGSIPGKRFRNVRVSPLLRGLTTLRVAFPAFVMAYHYRGRPYRAVVSGHDAAGVVGTAPRSWAKVALVVLAVLAVVALIVALVAR